MKTMKAVCTATVLALTLSGPAFAGDIACPDAARPGGTVTSGVSSVPSTPSPDTSTFVADSERSALGDLLLALMSMF